MLNANNPLSPCITIKGITSPNVTGHGDIIVFNFLYNLPFSFILILMKVFCYNWADWYLVIGIHFTKTHFTRCINPANIDFLNIQNTKTLNNNSLVYIEQNLWMLTCKCYKNPGFYFFWQTCNFCSSRFAVSTLQHFLSRR